MARQRPNYYDVLGVSRDASQDVIKSAYRKLAVELHPDKTAGDKALEERFKSVTEAYEVLKDPDKRKQYDSPTMGFSFGDIFANSFGSTFTGGFSFTRGQRGQDIVIILELMLGDVLAGVRKTIRYKRFERCESCDGQGSANKSKCTKCGGSGRIRMNGSFGNVMFINEMMCDKCRGSGLESKGDCDRCSGSGRALRDTVLQLNVTAGVSERDELVMRHHGHCGEHNGVYGNLVVRFKVKDHPFLVRQSNGVDVVYECHLSITQAVFGCKVRVGTLRDEREIAVAAGTKQDDRHVISCAGLPSFSDNAVVGDQIIRFVIDIPTILTDRQRDLFNKLRQEGL